MNLLKEICLINGQMTGFQSPFGLRMKPVYCLTRDQRQVTFAQPVDVPHLLEKCLANFEQNLLNSQNPEEVAESAAIFWMGFIAIHPFTDGNGRTGREYLSRRLTKLGYELLSFDLIEKYLIEGDPEKELSDLKALFLVSIGLTNRKDVV